MNTETIDNPYIITYSNHFVFESKTFAFRKKELFDISGIPSLIARTEQGWWIGRKLLSKYTAPDTYGAVGNAVIDIDEPDWSYK